MFFVSLIALLSACAVLLFGQAVQTSSAAVKIPPAMSRSGGPLSRRLHQFGLDESGATTVDFVVLTAAIVMLGSVVTFAVGTETASASDDQARCLRIAGRQLIKRQNRDYGHRIERVKRRCGTL